MPRILIKLKDRYFEWSTIVDAPVTYGMTEEELREYYQSEYGRQGMLDFEERLARTNKNGHSSYGTTLENLISPNRAGPKEKNISVEQIYEQYTQPNPRV